MESKQPNQLQQEQQPKNQSHLKEIITDKGQEWFKKSDCFFFFYMNNSISINKTKNFIYQNFNDSKLHIIQCFQPPGINI
jgi:hypothetical protein